MTRLRTFNALALGAAISLAGATARADDEEDARSAMRRGVAAFGRGDAAGALSEYETAKRLVPAANAPYRYAAEALASLGRWPEAVQNLEGYLAKNAAVSDASDVRARIAKIRAEHYPARVHVEADDAGAVVTVDGVVKGSAPVLELAPGNHRIVVTAPGKTSTPQDVTLIGDSETNVVFALTAAPEAATLPASPSAVVVPATGDMRAGPWRTIGWVGAGVGVGTLATMLVIDAAVLGPTISSYERAADRGETSARDLHSEATGLRTGVIVGYAAGGILTLGGIALILFAPSGSRAAVVPSAAPGYGGIVGRASF